MLKVDDQYFLIYSIKITKKQVIVTFGSIRAYSKQINIPLTEVHATYPFEGNLHYSYKKYPAEVEHFITGYAEYTKYKKILPGEKITEEIEGKTFLNLFVPPNSELPISELAFPSMFPMLAFGIPECNIENILVNHKEASYNVDTDIILDGRGTNRQVNVQAFVSNNDITDKQIDAIKQSDRIKIKKGCFTIGMIVREF